MFDRFTDRARRVMGLARQEAVRLKHSYIGTEHFLLGLIAQEREQRHQGRRDTYSSAGAVLAELAIDPEDVLREVEKIVQEGPTMVTHPPLLWTDKHWLIGPPWVKGANLYLSPAWDTSKVVEVVDWA